MIISEKEAARMGLFPPPAKSKYGAHKEVIDGIRFDSKKEANRYLELKRLERLGLIGDLELQKEFVLVPAQFETVPRKRGGGFKKGKCIERAVKYKADFYYFDTEAGVFVCEDVKGVRTKEYVIKRKLMLYVHDIRIKEI